MVSARLAAAAAVAHQRAEQAEDRRRGPHRHPRPAEEGEERRHRAAEQEPGDAGEGVEDRHAAGAVELGGERRELAQPEQVEEEVEEVAVQPPGRERGPPAAELEDQDRAARPEAGEGLGGGREVENGPPAGAGPPPARSVAA